MLNMTLELNYYLSLIIYNPTLIVKSMNSTVAMYSLVKYQKYAGDL